MTVKNLSTWRNQESLDNDEDVDLGAVGRAKRVILFDSSGNEIVLPSASSSITDGTTTVATAGTAVQLSVASVPCKGVWVCADLIAGIIVTVGAATVKGNGSGMRGVVLTPGSTPVFLTVANLNLLFVDAQLNGGKLSWVVQA